MGVTYGVKRKEEVVDVGRVAWVRPRYKAWDRQESVRAGEGRMAPPAQDRMACIRAHYVCVVWGLCVVWDCVCACVVCARVHVRSGSGGAYRCSPTLCVLSTGGLHI